MIIKAEKIFARALKIAREKTREKIRERTRERARRITLERKFKTEFFFF